MARRKGKRGGKAKIVTTMTNPFGGKGMGKKSKRGRRR